MHTLNSPAPRHLQRSALSLAAAIAFATLAACSSMPERNAALDQARSRLDAARTQTNVLTLAPDEFKLASDAVDAAERARARGDTLAAVDHMAYLASQRVSIAQESAASRSSDAVTASAGAERDRMRLALRTQEADTANTQLALSQQSNARTAQDLAASERSGARKSAELAQADASAQADQARLARRDAQVSELQAQMRELNARQTERGIVVTLGDLLFDSGRAQLKGDGASTMSKLAEFLQRNPERTASIEGYTDSVGGTAFNQELSDRRAQSVKDALAQRGVQPARLSTHGFGQGNPVADNGTAAGRQMNRRVEVVFAPAAGDVLMK